jgi:WD40 repeat protein
LAHDDWIRAVAFSPDGACVTTVCDDKTARVWEIVSGRQLACLSHADYVFGVAISPDGARIATACGGSKEGIKRPEINYGYATVWTAH